MFTGIITAIGEVLQAPSADGRLRIRAPADWLQPTAVGDSIAVDGACLTATTISEDSFTADISLETAACCAGWKNGASVNLEHPMTADGKIGGHFVSGHVEGVACLSILEESGDGRRMVFSPPPALMKFIIPKGSVTVGGVSLTVAAVGQADFAVQVVPHTLSATTLGRLQTGDFVNMESDLLARHLHRLTETG